MSPDISADGPLQDPSPSPRSRISWPVLLIGLAIVVPLIAVLFSGFGHDPHFIASPLIGKPAPDFALKMADTDQEVTLASLRGKPLVLNFFSTWCVPCEQEHPMLLAAARRFKAKANFVGIIFEDTKASVNDWLQRHGGRGYPVLIDVGGPAAIAYGVYGVPETFFIDANGVIRDKVQGAVDFATIQTELEALQ